MAHKRRIAMLSGDPSRLGILRELAGTLLEGVIAGYWDAGQLVVHCGYWRAGRLIVPQITCEPRTCNLGARC